MDELRGFCVRMLGDGEAARATIQAARASGGEDRVRQLTVAATACREHLTENGPDDPPGPGDSDDLPATIARELAGATAELPERQREALALRDLLGLDYEQIGPVLGVDPAAVGPLLARARLRLRTEIRGESSPVPACDERERALRTIALRQDGEAVPEADEDWLLEHLGHCTGCARAHAAMLEASACYRAWRIDA